MDSISMNSLIIFAFIVIAFLLYKVSSFKTHLSILKNDNINLKGALDSLSTEKIEYVRQEQELRSQLSALNTLIQEQDRVRQEAFSAAKASLFDLGNDLSKRLVEIHKQETKDAKEASDKKIVEETAKFHVEFERLVNTVSILAKEVDHSKFTVDVIKKSLLSPSGVGRLAEITLENILKSSGLRSGVDYNLQHSIENEGKIRPDAVIFLPSNNLMVIDAKASKFLLEMGGAQNEQVFELAKISFSKTMNAHLKSLASKEYGDNMASAYRLRAKSFGNVVTLMFLPTESALEKIDDIDRSFIERAWSYNIFPVGPAGLMNMLSFAKFQINDHMRGENHKLIIEEVRKLLISVQTLTQHSQRLGNNIQTLANSYDKFSGSFNRNFLPKARNIQSLGVDIGKEAIKPLDRYHIISSQVENAQDDLLISNKEDDHE
jgi:DNA recombination protein RmuC